MGGQWTEEDPGAGLTGALQSLEAQLGETAVALDSDQADFHCSLGAFSESWSGLAADAAKARIKELKRQAGALADAAESAKQAVSGYAAEVDAIKALANDQMFIRDAARNRPNDLDAKLIVVADPDQWREFDAERKEMAAAEESAVASLSRLAKRRQDADAAALKSVRSVIAEHWDVPPGDWPSERSWEQQASYQYDMKHPLRVSTSDYSAKDLTDLFKEHPSEIFPFTVKGLSGGFEDGSVFELSNTLPGNLDGIETGEVVIETTDTSVKFTVLNDGYFDGRGSSPRWRCSGQ